MHGRTTLYLEGDRIVRRVRHAISDRSATYVEGEIDRFLNPEHTHILPAKGRGSAAKLTESTAGSRLHTAGISVALGNNPEILHTGTGHADPVADPLVPDPRTVTIRDWFTAGRPRHRPKT